MPRTSIQFHAMPSEIAEFLGEIVADASLRFTELRGACFSPRPLDRNKVADAAQDSTTVAIAITLVEPVLCVGSIHQFHKSNPDLLVVEIGRPTAAGLQESWLWATSDNPVTMKAWRRIARKLATLYTTGGSAENLNTGARGTSGNHRFSPGARLAYSNGMRLLPVAGLVVFHPA